MKGELPLERQAVQVQIDNGEWQAATYQDGQFVDLYGLPLDHQKVTSWRPAGGSANGRTAPNRDLRTQPWPQLSQARRLGRRRRPARRPVGSGSRDRRR